jgi:hypothetical protein
MARIRAGIDAVVAANQRTYHSTAPVLAARASRTRVVAYTAVRRIETQIDAGITTELQPWATNGATRAVDTKQSISTDVSTSATVLLVSARIDADTKAIHPTSWAGEDAVPLRTHLTELASIAAGTAMLPISLEVDTAAITDSRTYSHTVSRLTEDSIWTSDVAAATVLRIHERVHTEVPTTQLSWVTTQHTHSIDTSAFVTAVPAETTVGCIALQIDAPLCTQGQSIWTVFFTLSLTTALTGRTKVVAGTAVLVVRRKRPTALAPIILGTTGLSVGAELPSTSAAGILHRQTLLVPLLTTAAL